ncbi:hypothetical protein GH733_015517 [Mirounga leonina]|nr:hypothetical protein GH733_015517 [Mirounga leonina]
MTQDQPLLAVHEALRKCFPVVEEQQGLWQSTLRDSQPLLASLSNLAEQLRAAHNLRFEDVPPLRAFPDLKERLRRKQLAAGDTVLDKLGERLHVEQVLEIYEQHADSIGIDALLQASVVSPSVADMLEWLQDIERHYRNSYPVECFLLPGGVKKPCVYQQTRGTQLKTDVGAFWYDPHLEIDLKILLTE